MLSNNSGAQLKLSLEAWAGLVKMNKSASMKNSQTTFADRIAYLENTVQELADKQQRELEAEREAREAQTKSQQMKTMQLMLNNNSGAIVRLSMEAWAGLVKVKKGTALKND